MRIDRLFSILARTKDTLDEDDVRRASRGLVADGMCSMSMVTLQGGPFLAAFAIALGATNYEIGLLATIGLLSQIMQLPGLYLVQRFPRRRAIVFAAAAISRLLWIFIILVPALFLDRGVTFLMQWLFLAAMAGALAGPAWNSLIRDSVPQEALGRIFSKRLVLGTGFAMALTLGGGYFVDAWTAWRPEAPLYAYSILFSLGLLFGLGGVLVIARMPEATMPAQQAPFLGLLAKPVKDPNFRGLLKYIAFWSFSINLAMPFFIVYMLNRIEIPLGTVTALVVASQLTNMVFLRIWGRLADRFSNKSVLAVSGPLFLVAVLGWTFTTMPERHAMTVPLLFLIHVLSGMSLAGVTLGTANIALKLSPSGQGHSYMALYGMAGALAGATAPMLGGMFADFFAAREFSIAFNWAEPGREVTAYAMNLKALDFLFMGAFVLGLFSLRLLRKVTEEGEVEEKVVRSELLNETFSAVRTVSTAPGIRYLVAGPISAIFDLALPLRRPSFGNARRDPANRRNTTPQDADEQLPTEEPGQSEQGD